jgi:hypothetical protein
MEDLRFTVYRRRLLGSLLIALTFSGISRSEADGTDENNTVSVVTLVSGSGSGSGGGSNRRRIGCGLRR